MKKIDILYLYEKAVRELDVACAIKYLAKKHHGLKIEIIEQNFGYNRAFREYKPKVIVLPFCYQTRGHNQFLFRWRKAIYFNLTWEQLFYPGNIKAKAPHGEFACNHVLHHAWSDLYHDFLLEQNIPEKHIFVNGNPALALYEPPYCDYFIQKKELAARHKLDISKQWIFFPENYNWAFYEKPMLDLMIQEGQPEKQVYSMREFAARSFEEAIKWCHGLSQKGNCEVIIRPRPSTLLSEFTERVNKIIVNRPARMHIIQNESVREWIMASDVVVSSYSTSLIEAAVAGKVAYMIEPYPIPESLFQQWHNLLYHIKTKQEFIDLCSSPPETAVHNPSKLRKWARDSMMGRGDAIQNLVDFLANICQNEIPIPSPASVKSITPEFKKSLFRNHAYYLNRKFRGIIRAYLPAHGVSPEYLEDVALEAEIPQRVARWGKIIDHTHD